MKYQILTMFLLMVPLANCGEKPAELNTKTDDVAKVNVKAKSSVNIDEVAYPNLFKLAGFEDRNKDLRHANTGKYFDSDTNNFIALKAGAYTSDRVSALRVCADLRTAGASPGISVRGKATNTMLTAMLTENNSEISFKDHGGIGEAELSNGKLCIKSDVLPAGSTLRVLVFPALSQSGLKHEKSAVGDVEIKDLSISWVDA